MVYFKQVYGNALIHIGENGQRTRCNSSLEDELTVQDDVWFQLKKKQYVNRMVKMSLEYWKMS